MMATFAELTDALDKGEIAGDDFADPETYVEIARNFDSFLAGLKAVE